MSTRTRTATATELDVTIKELPAQDYLGRTFTSALDSIGRDVQDTFRQLYARIGEARSRPAGPPFLSASQPTDGVMQIEVGAPCSPVPEPTAGLHAGRLEAGRAAVLLYRGPYGEIGPMYGRLFAWIAQHGYRQAGAPREVYLNGPGEVSSPADFLTEIVLPVA